MNPIGMAALALHAETPPNASNQRWVHLVPAGTFRGMDGRGPYSLDRPDAVIQASRERAGKVAMVLDYEHQTDHKAKNGQPAPAAGWIVGLQARKDGIWGLVELTPKAADHLANREYRYVSPVFTHDASGQVMQLLRASLTNTPNLGQQLTALATSELSMDLLSELIGVFGLAPEATAEDVVGAARQLVTSANSQAPDPARFVPIGDFQQAIAEVNKLRQGISKQAAEEHVDGFIRKGVILPFMRDWAVSLCSSNLPAFDEFAKGCGKGFSHLLTSTHASTTPPAEGGADVGGIAGDVARQLGLDTKEFSTHLAKSAPGGI
jgi:phage I-like protein